jgi:hypothetical protein
VQSLQPDAGVHESDPPQRFWQVVSVSPSQVHCAQQSAQPVHPSCCVQLFELQRLSQTAVDSPSHWHWA